MSNCRRPWHQRLVRRVARDSKATDPHQRHPLWAWGHLYLFGAAATLACSMWAFALVFSLASAGSFLCLHWRLSHSQPSA